MENDLFLPYVAAKGAYDELLASPANLRPAWRTFQSAAAHLDGEEFGRRWRQAQEQLARDSLAYPDPREARTDARPWELDALPCMVTSGQWAEVANALRQRARLLELILRDAFGPQKILQDKIVPPEVLYLHPGFRLAYSGQIPPHGQLLHFYAADLARSPDGQWWVLADRTEAPSGLGFALENRIATSRMLPEVIRTCQVERLAPFFIAVQQQLKRILQQSRRTPARANPRIILWTQTGDSAGRSEDSFLARYLGYTLAEAGDLAVRGNGVFLKTLGGLSAVDVLLRRPSSDECDPLELSTEETPTGGIAGLMQVARGGGVGVANALGSGLVESPVFMAYLPQLCEQLLGESLLMPGVATWWCGDKHSLLHVLERIDELQIKPAFRRRRLAAAEIARLSGLSRGDLIARIQADPAGFVAQERVVRSCAPTWNEGRVEAAYIALRAFAVAEADGYVVMPGGLARVSSTLTPLEHSLLEGDRSKDTWVLADGPVAPITLLPTTDEVIPLKRGGAELPSRVAENVFWLGRQTERAEALARLLRTTALRLASEEPVEQIPDLPLLLRLLAEKGQIEPGFVVEGIRSQLPAIERQLPAIVFDDLQPGALRSTVSNIASLAATVRDRISIDGWRIIRQMHEEFWPRHGGRQEPAAGCPPSPDLVGMLQMLDELIQHLAAFTGLVMESMTRTPAWRFLDFGRRLERALQTTSLLQNLLQGDLVHVQPALETTLEVAESLMTYRSRYLAQVQLAPVLDLLLTDETNPRSVAFQLFACADHVQHMPRDPRANTEEHEMQIVKLLTGVIRSADAQQLAGEYLAQDTQPLVELLALIDGMLPELADAISHRYLVHSGPVHRLVEIDPG